MSDLRTRIAAALKDVLGEQVYTVILNAKEPFSMIVDGEVDLLDTADAVIRELKQEWRADFGYDGYAKCETHDEAKEQVDDFNEALGDDIRDGEQAMVMHRYVTEWEIHD
jgi:hypothetical protein